MNWLDILLLILLAGSVVTSFSTGLAREVVGLISLIAALVLAIWFYGSAGAFLLPYVSSPEIAHFCGFLLVFAGVLILGGILGRLLARFMKVAGLSFVDRLLGAGFGLVRGLLISIAFVMALLAFTPGKSPPGAVVHSRVAPYVIDAARVCVAIAPHELKEGFHKSYQQVKSIWGSALKKGIRELPDAGKA
ncbi:MAG TPA: CvpA family protein [Bryobacteraceae bacterium]|nr:CvpA family protein [Bryobacteraceae bacterium]